MLYNMLYSSQQIHHMMPVAAKSIDCLYTQVFASYNAHAMPGGSCRAQNWMYQQSISLSQQMHTLTITSPQHKISTDLNSIFQGQTLQEAVLLPHSV